MGVKLCPSFEWKKGLLVFENRMLRIIFGPKSDEVTGIGKIFTLRSCIIRTVHKILLG
jgi:hypothetical protein